MIRCALTKLIATVCKLSLTKPDYSNIKNELEFIIQQIETELDPKLQSFFQRDADIFDQVIHCRQARDRAEKEGDESSFKQFIEKKN